MGKLIFHINYYLLIDMLQIVVKILQKILQLIKTYEKLNYLKNTIRRISWQTSWAINED